MSSMDNEGRDGAGSERKNKKKYINASDSQQNIERYSKV